MYNNSMCRLFGFKSVITGNVHSSLLEADNALVEQSHRHPDGWGLAYFVSDYPQLIRNHQKALECDVFEKVAASLKCNTLVAHIRKATVGKLGLLNTHPFQYGPWTFAHNGNIANFSQFKLKIEQKILSDFRNFILGDTDSEYLFYWLLSKIKQSKQFHHYNPQTLVKVISEFTNEVEELVGSLTDRETPDLSENYLTFILARSDLLLGHSGGQPLYWSTHKSACPEKTTCQFYNKSCENKITKLDSNQVNHLVLSSEPINGPNVWNKTKLREIVLVDSNLGFYRFKPTTRT